MNVIPILLSYIFISSHKINLSNVINNTTLIYKELDKFDSLVSQEIKKSLESSGNYLGLKRFIEKMRKSNFSICFAIETDSRIRRLKKILLDFDIEVKEFELSPKKWINLNQDK